MTEKKSQIPQEASQINPAAKPQATKGGINNVVTMPIHSLIADKDYPSGIREWMQTAPAELKFPVLVVAASMLSVYLTRVRLQYVYDNDGERSACRFTLLNRSADAV